MNIKLDAAKKYALHLTSIALPEDKTLSLFAGENLASEFLIALQEINDLNIEMKTRINDLREVLRHKNNEIMAIGNEYEELVKTRQRYYDQELGTKNNQLVKLTTALQEIIDECECTDFCECRSNMRDIAKDALDIT